jgi:hypothetical protein
LVLPEASNNNAKASLAISRNLQHLGVLTKTHLSNRLLRPTVKRAKTNNVPHPPRSLKSRLKEVLWSLQSTSMFKQVLWLDHQKQLPLSHTALKRLDIRRTISKRFAHVSAVRIACG